MGSYGCVSPYIAPKDSIDRCAASAWQAFEPFLQNNALTTTGVVGIGEGRATCRCGAT